MKILRYTVTSTRIIVRVKFQSFDSVLFLFICFFFWLRVSRIPETGSRVCRCHLGPTLRSMDKDIHSQSLTTFVLTLDLLVRKEGKERRMQNIRGSHRVRARGDATTLPSYYLLLPDQGRRFLRVNPTRVEPQRHPTTSTLGSLLGVDPKP